MMSHCLKGKHYQAPHLSVPALGMQLDRTLIDELLEGTGRLGERYRTLLNVNEI